MKKFNQLYVVLALLIVLFASCKDDEIDPEVPKDVLTYVFLGHTYEGQNTVDHRIPPFLEAKKEEVNGIDGFWLGGDMCSETTKEEATIQYLDDLFDLGNPSTLWTLGNHDIRNGNIDWITTATERPTYYTTHQNGITFIVINNHVMKNQVYDTVHVKTQYEMIKNVCDTIQNSSHLIILSHYVTWENVPNLISPNDYANANVSWVYFNLEPNQRFSNGIYPLLQQAKARGVEVLNIAGDLGQKAISYESISDDGIHFIGSGIASDIPYNEQFPTNGAVDEVLVLTHNLKTRALTWHFEAL